MWSALGARHPRLPAVVSQLSVLSSPWNRGIPQLDARPTPSALLHRLKHYNALHERNVFVTVELCDLRWVSFENRVSCEKLGHDFWRVPVRMRFGFMKPAGHCRRACAVPI